MGLLDDDWLKRLEAVAEEMSADEAQLNIVDFKDS